MSEEPREFERRTREQHGLRADQAWVAWVAEQDNDGGMLLNIPLAAAEFEELRSRDERARAAVQAFRAAGLASEAGAWIDQPAGGVVRLQLAHPSATERAVAERIVAEYGGDVELVEHTTGELEQVVRLIDTQVDARSAFGRAATSWGIDVSANVVSLSLRGDPPPDTPQTLQAAVDAGQLLLFWPTEPAGW